MGYCCKLFPARLKLSTPITNNKPTIDSALAYISPRFVYMDNQPGQKIFASDMQAVIATGSSSSQPIWSLDGGVLYVYPGISSVVVIGDMKAPEYNLSHLDHELGVVGSLTGNTFPGLTGAPLTVVRYRTALRVAEDIEDLQRAQYLLQMVRMKEAECRSSFEDNTTSSLGYMQGEDIL